MPGVARGHQLAVHVDTIHHDAGDPAAILVAALVIHLHRLAEDQCRKRLARCFAIVLADLGRVDVGESNLLLLVRFVEAGECVAVLHAHHPPEMWCRDRRWRG